MELKTAVELQLNHYGHDGIVRIDTNGYFNLNELGSFYPNKRMDHWLENATTQEFISLVERQIIIPGKAGIIDKAIIRKRGKGGGTYAHELVAMEFCMWLSPEFKLQVLLAYQNRKSERDNWNLQRILAAESIKFQNEAIKENIIPKIRDPAHAKFVYSNNADLLNQTVFGRKAKGEDLRSTATDEELAKMVYATNKNAHYIEEGLDHATRKVKVAEAVNKKCCKHVETLSESSQNLLE